MAHRDEDSGHRLAVVSNGGLGLEPVIAGKYRIESVLGQGALATVYRAGHVEVGSLCYAVKVLRRTPSADPTIRERFRREAELAASLKGRHSVRVIDFGETESGHPYLVMPFLEGASADQLMQRLGPFRPGDAAQIGLDVLDALQEAHELGIIHRDIKPANLLLLQDRGERHPICKVLDFGIAKVAAEHSSSLLAMTAENSFLGTPTFGAPESLSGVPERRSDLYSLGHTLALLIEGEAPYASERTHALVIQRHLSLEPVPLGPKVRKSGLFDVIRRACEKPVDQRFRTAQQMRQALRETGVADEERPALVVVLADGVELDNAAQRSASLHRLEAIGAASAELLPIGEWAEGSPDDTVEEAITPERGRIPGPEETAPPEPPSELATDSALEADNAGAASAQTTSDAGDSAAGLATPSPAAAPHRRRLWFGAALASVAAVLSLYLLGPTGTESPDRSPAVSLTGPRQGLVSAPQSRAATPQEATPQEATVMAGLEPSSPTPDWRGDAVRSASATVALAAWASDAEGRRADAAQRRVDDAAGDGLGAVTAEAETIPAEMERRQSRTREPNRRRRHRQEPTEPGDGIDDEPAEQGQPEPPNEDQEFLFATPQSDLRNPFE